MGDQKVTNVIVLVGALIGFLLYVFQRLVRIEQELIRNTEATKDVAKTVHQQNGRIGKLESWRWQITGAFLLVGVAAPFVFWGLGFLHH